MIITMSQKVDWDECKGAKYSEFFELYLSYHCSANLVYILPFRRRQDCWMSELIVIFRFLGQAQNIKQNSGATYVK